MRTAQINRKTTETDIALTLNVDGTGASSIQTGCGFLDHMLTLFAKHGRFDLTVTCVGDTYVDYHHTVEDVAICLGKAFFAALGNKAGICRYGDTILPMDEALILSAVDFSGRSYFGCDFDFRCTKVGAFDVELVEEFWQAFTANAFCCLHLIQIAGKKSHHLIEGAFKSVARSVKKAVAIDETLGGEVPSTKGVL
jgi:imidazoleglycerol-phosphate dehydratase